jgi:phosphoglycolate phosphatase
VTGSVLFDLDGVLVDSRAPIAASINHALAARGYPARDEAELYRYIGPPLLGTFADLTGLPLESEEVLALAGSYRDRYALASLTETVVVPGIEHALDVLGRTHTLAVATSKPKPFAIPLLETLGLASRFAYIAGPALDSHMQPKAETVREALAHAGGPAVMIGDRVHDVEGARENGIPVIAVAWGIGDAAELAGADVYLAAPDELPAAVERLLRPASRP